MILKSISLVKCPKDSMDLLFCASQTFSFRRPYMHRYPRLRQKPDQPDPSELIGHELLQEVPLRTRPEQILGHERLEKAFVFSSDATCGNQHRDTDGDGQADGECKTEPLNADLARELGEDVADESCTDLDHGYVDGGHAYGIDEHLFVEGTGCWHIWHVGQKDCLLDLFDSKK